MKTILLADDSITIQKVVELTFSEADYRVICVSSGGQALQKVAETRPDIILLDVIMPEKNGYEVCEHLKRNPSTRGIPILLLTGTFEPFDKKRADAAGADGHVTKPFESQVLVGKVEELIASTPAVSSDDEEGRMDIISGGDIYHVDPGRAAEGMRAAVPPMEPPPTLSPADTAPGGAFTLVSRGGLAMPPVASPAPDHDLDVEEREGSGRPHPAMATPDPAAGGSYVGFADVGMAAAMEGEVVPDRFDDPLPSATARMRGDEAMHPRGSRYSAVPVPGEAPAPGAAPGGPEVFEGSFEQEFDMGDELPDGGTTAAGPDEGPVWSPPPEAPPAETWQTIDEPSVGDASSAVATGFSTPPTSAGPAEAPPGDGKGIALTPEMIDLIADKVVQRLADRVVREIAWEVVPGVAEIIVRRRIKELEDSGSE